MLAALPRDPGYLRSSAPYSALPPQNPVLCPDASPEIPSGSWKAHLAGRKLKGGGAFAGLDNYFGFRCRSCSGTMALGWSCTAFRTAVDARTGSYSPGGVRWPIAPARPLSLAERGVSGGVHTRAVPAGRSGAARDARRQDEGPPVLRGDLRSRWAWAGGVMLCRSSWRRGRSSAEPWA
jgi:hypothetical protein